MMMMIKERTLLLESRVNKRKMHINQLLLSSNYKVANKSKLRIKKVTKCPTKYIFTNSQRMVNLCVCL